MSRAGRLLPGVVAVLLFAVLAAVFVAADFGSGAGFPADVNITAGIGYLLFDLTGQTELGSEGFLAAFEIIDVVLVSALVGAVMLARREDREPGLLRTDGGDRGTARQRTRDRGGDRDRDRSQDGGGDR